MDARLAAPEDDWIPTETIAFTWTAGVDFASRDDAIAFGKISMPLTRLERALPHEARSSISNGVCEGNELSH